jgi:hypothetical protein
MYQYTYIVMIAEEVRGFKQKCLSGQVDGFDLPPVPKPTEPYYKFKLRLLGPTLSPQILGEREDKDDTGFMDIDEELKMRGH